MSEDDQWEPPPPPLEQAGLETIAASAEATATGAWWITLQVIGHFWEEATVRDARTIEPLQGSLLDAVSRLPLPDSHPRPFPHDSLAVAAELLKRPLRRILGVPTERIKREHLMQPAFALRELDGRSMAWLAQRPGRTVREKLGGRAQALGVVRRLTVDTWENRVVRRVAGVLARDSEARLAAANGYGANDARREQLEELERLCTVRLRRSELGKLPPPESMRANNALLDHPDYAKVWRVWRVLRRRDDDLRTRWGDAEDAFRRCVGWLIHGLLLERPGAWTWERVVVVGNQLGRPVDFLDRLQGGGLDGDGAAVLEPASRPPDGVIKTIVERNGRRFGFIHRRGGEDLYFDGRGLAEGVSMDDLGSGQPVYFDVTPAPRGQQASALQPRQTRRVVVALDGEDLALRVEVLNGDGVRSPTVLRTIRLSLSLDLTAPLLPGRGVPWRVVVMGQVGWRGNADAEGAMDLARRLVKVVTPSSSPSDSVPGSSVPPPDVLGADWYGEAWLMTDQRGRRAASCAPRVTRIGLRDGLGFEWMGGDDRRAFHPAQEGVEELSLERLLTDDDLDPALKTEAIDRVVRGLADAVGGRPRGGLAWTVPDRVDVLSQRTLRGSIAARLGESLPVWRSVAAAMSFLHDTSRRGRIAEGDVVFVFDVEVAGLTISMLKARSDEHLARRRPTSHGIYWERRPCLPEDEHSARLSAAAFLRTYAEGLVGRQASRGVRAVDRARLVDYLLNSGAIEELLRPDAQVPRPVGDRWLVFAHSPKALQKAAASWLGALRDAVADWSDEGPFHDLLRSLSAKPRVLLVGRPITEWCGVEAVETVLRPLLRARSVHGIPSKDGALGEGAREALLRVRRGLPAWRDWLPDLYLEVVQDGLYDELKLVEERQVDAVLGRTTTIEVEQSLTLPAGLDAYSFPLESGRRNHRPMGHDVSLRSNAFPLDRDLRVRLSLSYRYGLANAWEMRVVPVDDVDAPFTSLNAQWARSARHDPDRPGPVPPFPSIPPRGDAGRAAAELLRLAQAFPDHLAAMDWRDRDEVDTAAKRLRRYRRSFEAAGTPEAWAVLGQKQWMSPLLDCLLGLVGVGPAPPGMRGSASSHARLRHEAVILLACLGESAPDVFVAILTSGIKEAVKNPRRFETRGKADIDGIGRLLARCQEPELVAALWSVVQRVRRWEAFSFRLRGLAAWARAAWRREDFVAEGCAAHPGAAEQLLDEMHRGLQRLSYSVAGLEEIDPDRHGIFLFPYQTYCEIVLALLRLRGTSLQEGLEVGRPRLEAIARTIRRLDGMLVRLDCRPKSHLLHLSVEKPHALHRVSDLAWVVSSALTGADDLTLVRIEASDGG